MRLGFVAPRYGDGVVGGSEAVMAEAARGLVRRGHEVEFFTTCARSHFSWENIFEPGVSEDAGMVIRRFRTVTSRAHLIAGELEARLQRGERLSPAEEIAWINGRFQVPDLFFYLSSHIDTFDAVVFSPYLFWSTIYGASISPERCLVMPCLHDEAYAWLGLVSSTLSSVGGVWFLSEPEHQLGHRVAAGITPFHDVVGAAVEVPVAYDAPGFCERHELTRPFVLYAGRREQGKGWQALLRAYAAALLAGESGLDLVTVGVGEAEIPDALRARVIDLGYLEAWEMPSAFAAASALVQPSANESFSRTVMESWLAGTLVIATGAGEVVSWHCERSGGGLTYSDDVEFAQCLRFLTEAPKTAASLAERGREYVLANYTWDIVLDSMERSLDRFAHRMR